MAIRKRLVTTSRGLIEIEISDGLPIGSTFVGVTVFRDDGWEKDPGKIWSPKSKPAESLAEFLTGYVELPEPEATKLAGEIQGPWREDWPAVQSERSRRIERWSTVAIAGFLLLVLLALAGVVLTVWLLVTQPRRGSAS